MQNDLASFIEKQETKNESLELEMKQIKNMTAGECIKELENRNDSNVIFFGVPESASQDIEKRKDDDLKQVKSLCDVLGVDFSFKKPVRLGDYKKKKPNVSRPLRVTAKSEDHLYQLLSQSHKISELQDDLLKKFSVRKDRTPLEREERRLLEEMRDKKKLESEENGENANWVIRKGRVRNAMRPWEPQVVDGQKEA